MNSVATEIEVSRKDLCFWELVDATSNVLDVNRLTFNWSPDDATEDAYSLSMLNVEIEQDGVPVAFLSLYARPDNDALADSLAKQIERFLVPFCGREGED